MIEIHEFHWKQGLQSIGYLVADSAAKRAIVIDAPPHSAEAILEKAKRNDLRIVAAVITHGHWDHFADAKKLQDAGVPVATHTKDRELLEAPRTNEVKPPFNIELVKPDRVLENGDVVTAGSLRFTVLHTPGHSPGSICLHEAKKGLLFTGDTLFAGGIGRTDFRGGSSHDLSVSLRKLAKLSPQTIVYPGHGPATTIEKESA